MSTKQNYVTLNFNRGVISSLGLARQDIERLSLSSERQNNFPPRVLGSMMLRPGLGYINRQYNDSKAYHLKFIYDDEIGEFYAIIELTDGKMRVMVDDAFIERPYVTTGITNGYFTSNLNDWVDEDESGATSAYLSGGYMSLTGTRYNAARRRQQVSVAGSYRGVEHVLRITIARGDLLLKVGSTDGGEEYITERSLEKGTHDVAFTPTTSSFWIELANRDQTATLVDSCIIAPQGDMVLDTTWTESDLPNIRYDQSGDVIYVACKGQIQKKILRYGETSWSIVDYVPKDGPFRNINITTTRLTPSALSGDITLASSTSLFTENNIGSLFRINSIGQTVEVDVNGASQWSEPIRVTGVGSQRTFSVVRAGTWSGTVTLQRSLGEIGSWTDRTTYTSNGSVDFTDGLDNQIVYYRIGIDTGDYTSGTAELSLVYDYGGIAGIVRVTGYTDSQTVSASVLRDLGNTVATEDWEEGAWSPRRGFPSALALHDGRLYHGGLGKIFASESDGYENFDDAIEGDSAPFSRNIPKGSQVVKWMLSLKRLMFGTLTHEWFLRSSSYDETVTNENANVKSTSNQGCANVQAIEVDGVAMFIQKSLSRLFQSGYTIEADDFRSEDLSKIIPDFLEAGIVRIDVQRQPDTRVHCVLADGTVCILILDDLEDVKSWFTVDTDGFIEDVVIMPGTIEDDVYYSIRRTVDGSEVRYIEKWAKESECRGETINKMADSFITYTGSATTTLTGLDHIEGREVIVWADGADFSPDDASGVQQTYTVSGGQITLATAVSNAVIGLPYKAQYKSVKLSLQSRVGTSLSQIKIIKGIGLILKDTLKTAIKYGDSFDEMYPLQDMEDYEYKEDSTIYTHYDTEPMEFSGRYDSDTRIYLEAKAPRPCTVLACIAEVVMNESNQGQ